MRRPATLDSYVFGVRVGGEWWVRVGAFTGSGATVAEAMRNALVKAVN